uniref:Uncharacterized protein n=1 Tax=viral metagenome TaxID=1070528 RepID=A0A6C0JJB4_9ZZZZ
MSLFVNPQNQKLLWDVINKGDLIGRVFLNSSSQQKEEWFRTVIQLFYDKHMTKSGNRNITIHELQDINRQTLTYMNQKLREYLMPNQNVGTNVSSTMPSKQESYNEKFQHRQKEYEQMNEKKAPEVLNFNEKVEDQPISNMEDLIQSHIKMREAELKQYSPSLTLVPPHSVPGSQRQSTLVENVTSSYQKNEVVPLVIDKKTNITIEIETVEDKEPEKGKKAVSWQIDSLNSEQINIDEIVDTRKESRLEKLESLVLELANKVETIISEFQLMKSNEKSI